MKPLVETSARRGDKTQQMLEAVVSSAGHRVVVMSLSYFTRRHAFNRMTELIPGAEVDRTQMRLTRPDGREILFRVAGRDDRLRGLEVDARYEVGS